MDALAFLTIPRKWIDFDTELYATKWFDYRFLHPVEATYKYAEAYEKAWRASFARVLDERRAPYVKIFKSKDVFDLKGAVLTGLWRGRQIADAIGIPYEDYTSLAMEETLRFWQRTHLPRPAQIYSEQVIERVLDRWEKLQEAKLYYSRLDNYKCRQYSGAKSQNDHHEWLFAQAEKRGNADRVICNFLKDDLLPQSKIEFRYGPERSERILNLN